MLHLYDTPSHHSHLVTELTEVLFQICFLQIICIFGFVAGSVIIHEASGRNQSATGVYFFIRHIVLVTNKPLLYRGM